MNAFSVFKRNFQPIDATQQPSYAGSFYDPPPNAYSGGIFTPTADNFESGGVGSEFDDEPPLLEGNCSECFVH